MHAPVQGGPKSKSDYYCSIFVYTAKQLLQFWRIRNALQEIGNWRYNYDNFSFIKYKKTYFNIFFNFLSAGFWLKNSLCQKKIMALPDSGGSTLRKISYSITIE